MTVYPQIRNDVFDSVSMAASPVEDLSECFSSPSGRTP